jgi:hypothetical protein
LDLVVRDNADDLDVRLAVHQLVVSTPTDETPQAVIAHLLPIEFKLGDRSVDAQ